MFDTSWLRYIPYLQTEHYWALLWRIVTGKISSVPHSSCWTPVYVTHLRPIQSEACKTKAFPSTNCVGTVSVVMSWAVRSEWSLQGWCCRSCQGSILGHTLCGSWGGSPGNEAAEGAAIRDAAKHVKSRTPICGLLSSSSALFDGTQKLAAFSHNQFGGWLRPVLYKYPQKHALAR